MNDEGEGKSGWVDYPSGVGYDSVEFPLPAGETGPFGRVTEAIQGRHIGAHISTKVEEAVERDGGFQYRGQKNSAQTLAHYAGSLQGLGLIDRPTSTALDRLVVEFSKAEKGDDRKKIVREKIRPFLSNLRPAKRQS